MSWFKPTSRNDATIAVLLGDAPDGERPVQNNVQALPPVSSLSVVEALASSRPLDPLEEESLPEPPPATPMRSVLGRTLRFRGDLHADEDFVLQGSIEGAIHHSAHLGIGVEGVVKGDSRARSIVVEGTVHGDLYALESISLRSTALVTGNLFAPRVAIADGATFNGRIDMATAAKAARAVLDRQELNRERTESATTVAAAGEPVSSGE